MGVPMTTPKQFHWTFGAGGECLRRRRVQREWVLRLGAFLVTLAVLAVAGLLGHDPLGH